MPRLNRSRTRPWWRWICGLALAVSTGWAQQTYTPYTITTLAGSAGFSGSTNATGSAARFNHPDGVAVDASGNVYVADSANKLVRRIAAGGVVTTFATEVTSGVGAGTLFGVLGGIAVDAAGNNLYVTDYSSGAVYEITQGGVVTIFLAVGTLTNPYGLAVDASGNVYVADAGNGQIRKITSGGTVSTLAGTGGTFAFPVGVAVDSAGNVYVTDRSADVVRKVSSGGAVTTYAGLAFTSGTVDGSLTAARFANPSGIAIDASGNLFLTDSGQIVREINTSGIVTSLAGSTAQPGSTDGTGSTALFSFSGSTPAGIAVDHSGNFFVADIGNDTIRQGAASPYAPPVITLQPQTQSINAGTTATFSVVVSGTGPFTYQWSSSGGAIMDANGMSYTTGVAGIYQVVVVGPGGTVFSSFASLTVNTVASPPVFSLQPSSQTVAAGTNVTLTAAASNAPTYQWSFDGNPIAGATSATLTFSSVTATNAGYYTVVASNSGGSVTSGTAVLTILSPPTITTQPQNLSVAAGGSATFQVAATGSGALSYQWQKNGSALGGATNPSLALTDVSSSDAGTYAVVVSNAEGSVTSASATLTVTAGTSPTAPAITTPPSNQTVTAGTAATFTVAASGTAPLSYQWNFNGAPVSGATNATLTLANAQTANAGTYSVTVSNGAGSVTSSSASLTVTAAVGPTSTTRLLNLSVGSVIQSSLTMGFVLGGAGTAGSARLLIRATGPSLAIAPFNVPGTLPDPTLTVVQQNSHATIASDIAGWGTPASNVALVQAADAATGAFALTNPASLDSALVTSLAYANGGYSAAVAGASGDSGYAITEVYDATPNYNGTTPRLINLSCATQIVAAGSLSVGFVISGPETLLIRANGPDLAAFGTSQVMPDPQLTVQALGSSTILAANAGWGSNQAAVTAADTATGAFAYTDPTSKDSAVVLNLAPASYPAAYTVVVSSASGTAGNVLVEIYEVP